MKPISRRRFLTFCASAMGAGILANPVAAKTYKASWKGIALGADAELTLYHPDENVAHSAIEACLDEVQRLEHIFSLFRRTSEVVQLNRQGRLEEPSPELVEVLRIARSVSEASNGAFDVTVQPLWTLYARHFAQTGNDPAGPTSEEIEQVLQRVDWQALTVSDHQISFGKPDMAITLNGIAQGYISDKVVEKLKSLGFENALVNMGEFYGAGVKENGRPWKVAMANDGSINLTNRALATSQGAATAFSHDGRHNHLFDPRVGVNAAPEWVVHVVAEQAALADALSTALCVAPKTDRQKIYKAFPAIQIY